MYGAKWLLALCLAAVSALTLLIPISCNAAEPDEFPWLLVTIRALMGIAEVRYIILIIQHVMKEFKNFHISRLLPIIFLTSCFLREPHFLACMRC